MGPQALTLINDNTAFRDNVSTVSGGGGPGGGVDNLLTEDGDNFLLEDGTSVILLE